MLPLAKPPENICILRLSALGDVTHAVPVVRAIQKYWPQARITWICAKLEHKLLSALEGIDFVVVDKNDGWSGYYRLWRQMAGRRFDIMLQMQTSARANVTGAMVRADIKLGWDRLRARDFHRWFMTDAIPQTRFEHQVQGHLSFARAMGLDVSEPEWDFPVSDDAIAFVNSVVSAEQKILLISPCSSHVNRNWRAERYAAVADHAITQLGMMVVLSGGPSPLERSLGEAIEAASENSLINLIGKDTLPQLVALLQRADIVLSPDSGPVHLANALGTPVIGLHACTWSRRSGPYHSLDLCIDKFAEAARRYRNSTPQQLRWGTRIEEAGVMDLVEVDEVIDRLELALSSWPE
ncbi:MAG: glycosyltransferase family 9 protein [Gammaproteobacteria bacterium]|nr:glycosyltransferase family 9 protein [Gammaproteobacteria bacterium]